MAEIQKVTDSNKIVTDPLVLKRLAEQGIDKDYVEFWHDYAPRNKGKEYSPYAKFYRDLKSGKRIMVASGLPMVKALGHKIECSWLYAKNKYYSKANLFSSVVEGTQIKVTCLSDQPNGRKEGDQVIWNPQLYFNNLEVKPKHTTASSLDVDHVNSNYHQNTLEWDYGICKRRIRVIEGRIREKWVFSENPHGTIRIKHNTSGDLPLKLGGGYDSFAEFINVQVDGDNEVILAEEFSRSDIVYPLLIGASPETFYPDAHPESTSVDGAVRHYDDPETWANIVAGAGTDSYDDVTDNYECQFKASVTTNRWQYNLRGIFVFDTSGVPDDAKVTAAVLSDYGRIKADQCSATPNLNAYKSTPASNTALQSSDYAQTGSVALSSAIAYGDWSTVGYNDFNLADVDTDNFGYISKTSVTKLCIKNANYDVANNPPNYVSDAISAVKGFCAEEGSGYKPKLVVTYELPQYGSATLTGAGSLSCRGVGIYAGKSILSGAGGLLASGSLLLSAKATLSGAGSLSAIGKIVKPMVQAVWDFFTWG